MCVCEFRCFICFVVLVIFVLISCHGIKMEWYRIQFVISRDAKQLYLYFFILSFLFSSLHFAQLIRSSFHCISYCVALTIFVVLCHSGGEKCQCNFVVVPSHHQMCKVIYYCDWCVCVCAMYTHIASEEL